MTEPAYPAARIAAQKVRRHFSDHLAAELRGGKTDLGPEPEVDDIEEMIAAAFWASLRPEERYYPRISLAFLPPGRAGQPLMFERPFALAPTPLTRLAPAVERPGIHLGVWRERNGLCVWGATRIIPRFCLVLEVVAPGLLVIKHRRDREAGKFVNVAVLEGDIIKVLNEDAARLPDCPALVTSLLGFDLPGSTGDSVNALVQLAVSMRAHGRGGALLVVPSESANWRESIVHPITYAVSPQFSELADLMREESGERPRRWKETLRRAVDAIAGLTAVDGATVITDNYDLLAFGAKIRRKPGQAPIERVIVTEPVEDAVADIVHPEQLGGTRHSSAAQFGQDQPDSVALVASQDGRFTVFAWSASHGMVHAHRIEALLL